MVPQVIPEQFCFRNRLILPLLQHVVLFHCVPLHKLPHETFLHKSMFDVSVESNGEALSVAYQSHFCSLIHTENPNNHISLQLLIPPNSFVRYCNEAA